MLRINFTKRTAESWIIDEFIKHFDLQINILQANLEFLRGNSIGTTLIAL
ncbi:NIL domain-containing protein [Coxiella-like endosymbiont]|nr:NIL domain-containing protein [Coxiella-like endosymbiont]